MVYIWLDIIFVYGLQIELSFKTQFSWLSLLRLCLYSFAEKWRKKKVLKSYKNCFCLFLNIENRANVSYLPDVAMASDKPISQYPIFVPRQLWRSDVSIGTVANIRPSYWGKSLIVVSIAMYIKETFRSMSMFLGFFSVLLVLTVVLYDKYTNGNRTVVVNHAINPNHPGKWVEYCDLN